MYTRDDYIKDCYLAENASGVEKSNAGIRKYYYEVGRVYAIEASFPEFADKKTATDSHCVYISGRLYDLDKLTDYKYNGIDYPDEISHLYARRTSLVRKYYDNDSVVRALESDGDHSPELRARIDSIRLTVKKTAAELDEIERQIEQYNKSRSAGSGTGCLTSVVMLVAVSIIRLFTQNWGI